MQKEKMAILVASFGTSYEQTRRKTLDRIEEDMRKAFPAYPVYRAWTSGKIRRKLEKRDGIFIPDVREALRQMAGDGVCQAVIQPTYVLKGIEYDRMLSEIETCRGWFDRVSVGQPLLSAQEDLAYMADVVVRELKPGSREVLVLMGHGTEHEANAVYAALEERFRNLGYQNLIVGTVEGDSGFESLLERVRRSRAERVILAPFMVVAGDHAQKDLAGEEPSSWKNRFEQSGYEVACVLKGLGEYEGVRRLFLAHAGEALQEA